MNTPRILIAEDEPIIALSLKGMIEELGFVSTGTVSSGWQVIDAVAQDAPDLVLMDISLDEELDGFDTAEMIREHHDIPVVFVTALSDAKLIGRAEKCGAFGYVTKPFDWANISNAIELALFRHGMERRLRESEERFRIFAQHTCDWEYWIGPKGEAIYHSPSCQRISGFSAESYMEQPNLLRNIIHPEDAARVGGHIEKACAAQGGAVDLDFRIITRDGQVRWINHVCQPVYDDHGHFRGRRAGNRDITDRKQLEIKLEHLAIHDDLTCLPNRKLLLDRLAQAIATASRNHGKMAVLFIDLDNFKRINDSFGHRVGDLTLKEVAQRIAASIRHSDTVARLGGDEFVVVLADVTESEVALNFARKIVQVLGAAFIADGKNIEIQASIGVAMYPDHGEFPEELLTRADAAMYKVKLAGRHGIEMASP